MTIIVLWRKKRTGTVVTRGVKNIKRGRWNEWSFHMWNVGCSSFEKISPRVGSYPIMIHRAWFSLPTKATYTPIRSNDSRVTSLDSYVHIIFRFSLVKARGGISVLHLSILFSNKQYLDITTALVYLWIVGSHVKTESLWFPRSEQILEIPSPRIYRYRERRAALEIQDNLSVCKKNEKFYDKQLAWGQFDPR